MCASPSGGSANAGGPSGSSNTTTTWNHSPRRRATCPRPRAPMTRRGAGLLRAPDILTVSQAGVAEYWEVKYRSRPDIDRATGEPCYWISDAALSDYLAQADRAPFWIVLHEAPNAHHSGRWLQASAHDVKQGGRRERRFGRGGEMLDAWVWPSRLMVVVPGPTIDSPKPDEPLVVNEGDGGWVENDAIVAAKHRQWQPEPSADTRSPADRLVRSDARLSLQAASPRARPPGSAAVQRDSNRRSRRAGRGIPPCSRGARGARVRRRRPRSDEPGPITTFARLARCAPR